MAPLRIGRSRLPELLEINRLSQAELARRLGVSEVFISQVKNGHRFFSLEMAMNAAKILKCNIEELHIWHR